MVKNSLTFETVFEKIVWNVCPIVLAGLTYIVALYYFDFTAKIISFLLLGLACFLWLFPFLKRNSRSLVPTLFRVVATALGYAVGVFFANTFFRFWWLQQYFPQNRSLYRWVLTDTLHTHLWLYAVAFGCALVICLVAMGLTAPTFLRWKRKGIRALRKKQIQRQMENTSFSALYQKAQNNPLHRGHLERYVALAPQAKKELITHMEQHGETDYLIALLLTHHGKSLTKEQFESYRQQHLQLATKKYQKTIAQLEEAIAQLPYQFEDLERHFARQDDSLREKEGDGAC